MRKRDKYPEKYGVLKNDLGMAPGRLVKAVRTKFQILSVQS